jgi:transmembrane sensor
MLRREAADWLARLRSDRDPDIQRKFEQWHNKDPRHAAAIDRMRGWYDRAGVLRHSKIAPPVTQARATRSPQWTLQPALAAAAAVVVLVPVGALLLRNGSLSFGGANVMMLMTSVGEIRQVKLADGSTVTLDTSTKLDVEIGRSRRSAHLRYGRARFRIAPADEPFVVETASSTITAQQGVIDVEQLGRQGRVRVLAGAADVRGSDQEQTSRLALGAGQSVTFDPGGPEQKIAAPSMPDWTRGMLQFDGTPLAEAVGLANRYSERKIILAGDFGPLRVTGAFRAGDSAGLARALAAAFALSLQQRPDGNLILSRSISPALQNKRGG